VTGTPLDLETSPEIHRVRLRAGRLALALGVLIFAGKLGAYFLTGSSAVFADAMESTVNIVAAAMLWLALAIAARPPDPSHPYGHGKVEFVSAGIEGAAICFAALVILAKGVQELIVGPEIQRLDVGLALLAVSGAVNAALGLHLTRVGTQTQSDALVADGRHVLTDVWTSAGVIGGLVVVAISGWVWADPLIAIAVAIHVAFEGVRLIQESIGGLMDEADEELIAATTAVLEREREPSWIDLHGLRCRRSGARPHFDMHMTVPRYFDVESLHAIHDRVEAALIEEDGHGGDVVIHFDPCHDDDCPSCAMPDCPIRKQPRREVEEFTPEHAILPDEALEDGR
jgi:cation diffusion facilitator family transporter